MEDSVVKLEIEECIKNGISDINEKIKKVKTQTNYDEKECIEKLKLFNYNELLVIKDYMNIDNNKNNELNNLSTQQKIFKSFREFF